ncbi:hypothetical protein J3U42_09415 [Gilliamella sp. B2923]|nr:MULTISPECIES: hypothetical protein [unclassified Gilliamella]MCX8628250.1 hypothetical protein [Gilliamella sp. B3976]MCX8601914.1 hypothetical protein [Gilliamella sp. B3722]MCX8608055.1 hypothetical protein [Gilliamella sp. B3771]MCX8611182.1 hypothetical protein [Gilliamella sp. B3891]MCX8613694.1 hypothetical protein [Gilliamella sp. B3773]
MTAHINANPNDFAQTVIMPGDPLRAKFIAENYLTDAKEVCNVRNLCKKSIKQKCFIYFNQWQCRGDV